MPSVAKKPAKAPMGSPAKTAASSKRAATRTAAKAAQAAKPTQPAKPAKEGKPDKLKVPLIRDSFTMPAADFALIAAMKLRTLKLMRPSKKSELLRAGLHALAALSDARLVATLNALTPLKPGRPKKAG